MQRIMRYGSLGGCILYAGMTFAMSAGDRAAWDQEWEAQRDRQTQIASAYLNTQSANSARWNQWLYRDLGLFVTRLWDPLILQRIFQNLRRAAQAQVERQSGWFVGAMDHEIRRVRAAEVLPAIQPWARVLAAYRQRAIPIDALYAAQASAAYVTRLLARDPNHTESLRLLYFQNYQDPRGQAALDPGALLGQGVALDPTQAQRALAWINGQLDPFATGIPTPKPEEAFPEVDRTQLDAESDAVRQAMARAMPAAVLHEAWAIRQTDPVRRTWLQAIDESVRFRIRDNAERQQWLQSLEQGSAITLLREWALIQAEQLELNAARFRLGESMEGVLAVWLGSQVTILETLNTMFAGSHELEAEAARVQSMH